MVSISPELPVVDLEVSEDVLIIQAPTRPRTTYTVTLDADITDRFGQQWKLLSLGRMPAQVLVDCQGKVALTHYGEGMSDIIPNERIMRFDPEAGEATIFREDSGRANGLMFDARGRLYACEGGHGKVTRTEADGSITARRPRTHPTNTLFWSSRISSR